MEPEELPRPVRWLLRAVGLGIGCAVVVGIVLAALHGFGWSVDPLAPFRHDNPGRSVCGEAHGAYERHATDAGAAADVTNAAATGYSERNQAYERWRTAAGLAVAVVEQNPQCFSVEDRAAAQVLKGRLSP